MVVSAALLFELVLETLEASNTTLTDIDLSKNLEIKNLNLAGCSSMHILDVTKNVAIVTLTINGCPITSLKTTRSLPIIGQYVVPDGELGVVFYSTGSVVKIVSKDETKAQWGYYGTTTGANSSTDGASNTDKIVAKSHAAQWCRAKGASWYLPALDELKAVYNNKSKLNATLSSPSVSGTQFGTNYYWSSTEYSSDSAYNVYFSGGSTDYNLKGSTCSVRAVRAL